MSQEANSHQKRKVRETGLPGGLPPVAPYARTTKFAHQLFEEQAARVPHQVAAVCQGRKLSYGELDARANQLALHLRSWGVGPNTLVAICVERSLEMVVGILAVLKAGGAYVPLDPAYPKERLAFMIADSEPAILLTQSHLAADLPRCQGPTFLLDALSYATRSWQTEKQGSKYSATDLAYVIYTSGPAGEAKGVMVTHGNLGHHTLSMQRATGIRGSDVYLHTASNSVSASARQLMSPLSVGATIVIATTDEVSDPIALFRTIKQLGVTVIDIVPSYWRSCVDALKSLLPAFCADLLANKLSLILSSGEPLSSDIPRAWRFQLKHQAQLMNMFGQTETAGIVSTYPIVPRDENKVGVVPIGRSINNVSIYLLDDQLQPVEFGEPGEICVGGPTVGRGYLNDPALSAARFAHDPFAASSNAKLYRTGDLGRMCADGTLEFQGHIEPSPATETVPGPANELPDEQVGTMTEPQDNSCAQELFEAQVELTPDAVAVVFGAQQISYRELNSRANQLAHHLRGLGVGAESLVAICVERSPEMLVGLLAILKAGGAYVPLDPAYPQERLAFMLADSDVSVLLTVQLFLEILPKTAAKTICLDADWDLIAAQGTHNPAAITTGANLAYVIYTSGSTGKPKGVLVTHENIVRLFAQTRAWFQFDERDVWTLFHSYAFDFSVWEIWGALNYGGRLVIVPYSVSRLPESFYEMLREQQVTVLNQTPSAFRQLIQTEQSREGAADLPLRLVIFGGEALDPRLLKPWLDRHGDEHPQLVNMYGITETTVHVTYRPLHLADLNDAPASLIGGPIADLELYVLDELKQIVPTGAPGELYVGGAGLARGYLNRPQLTAEKFIPDPFSDQPGRRLYRTGDRVRYRANGDVEYLGRVDNQVKVRGFRIELGEIEAVLAENPAVRESVVLAREDDIGEKRLVAYIVPTPGQSPSSDELRSFLLAQLPDYMVPSSVLVLEALPVTPNGKVDRQALLESSQSGDRQQDFAGARTPVEAALMKIWAEVFRLERVGINDNFFDLGGDSILGTLIVARAGRAGLKLSPRQLFEHQTIAGLSQVIALRGRAVTPAPSVKGPRASK